jgi:hypothetical protein
LKEAALLGAGGRRTGMVEGATQVRATAPPEDRRQETEGRETKRTRKKIINASYYMPSA